MSACVQRAFGNLQYQWLPPVEKVQLVSRRIGKKLGHGATLFGRPFHSFTPRGSVERNEVAAFHRAYRKRNPTAKGVRDPGYLWA